MPPVRLALGARELVRRDKEPGVCAVVAGLDHLGHVCHVPHPVALDRPPVHVPRKVALGQHARRGGRAIRRRARACRCQEQQRGPGPHEDRGAPPGPHPRGRAERGPAAFPRPPARRPHQVCGARRVGPAAGFSL